ncbi:MAG: polymer-forming cytoskeletal protein [Sphingobium sp.]
MANGARSATFSIIGADVVITGDIRASVDLHIDGRVEGDISCTGLVQGQGSHIKGQINAKSARLAGHVEGAVHAGELIIEAGARITGDISYESISVAQGAQVDGRFSHQSGSQGGADLKLISGDTGASA